jgi:hypothetical protein
MEEIPTFHLRFPQTEIGRWAGLYDYPGEAELIAGPVAEARRKGYLSFETFMAIGEWKSPRSRKRRALNEPAFVEEVTRLALDERTSPRLSVEVLTTLSGVDWPTASVILHFCHRSPYPILDFRALWSLSATPPSSGYRFACWDQYVTCCRSLAQAAATDMRTVDRALWKYSELHQA